MNEMSFKLPKVAILGILGLFCTIIGLYTMVYHQFAGSKTSKKTLRNFNFLQQIIMDNKKCILTQMDQLSKEGNDSIKNQVTTITQRLAETALIPCIRKFNYDNYFDVLYLENFFEKKGLIPFKNSKDSQNCVMVTIGVGGDVLAESKLKEKYPQCEFFGADPYENSGAAFRDIGKLFLVAVSGKTETYTGHILTDVKKNIYKQKMLNAMGFVEFILEKVQKKNIDFLWIDSEGSEHSIIEHFTDNGAVKKAGITICQMNIEFHGPPMTYGGKTNQEFLQNFRI